MNRTKVLVPLDGSETSQQILSVLCRFFQPGSIDVVLMRVMSPLLHSTVHAPTELYVSTFDLSLSEMRPWQGVEDSETHWQKNQDEARFSLESQARRLRKAGYATTIEVRVGSPVEEIARFVEEERVDLVAMATHGRKGINRLLMGSVAEEVLRTISVPILLDRPVANPSAVAAPRPLLYATGS